MDSPDGIVFFILNEESWCLYLEAIMFVDNF